MEKYSRKIDDRMIMYANSLSFTIYLILFQQKERCFHPQNELWHWWFLLQS